MNIGGGWVKSCIICMKFTEWHNSVNKRHLPELLWECQEPGQCLTEICLASFRTFKNVRELKTWNFRVAPCSDTMNRTEHNNISLMSEVILRLSDQIVDELTLASCRSLTFHLCLNKSHRVPCLLCDKTNSRYHPIALNSNQDMAFRSNYLEYFSTSWKKMWLALSQFLSTL